MAPDEELADRLAALGWTAFSAGVAWSAAIWSVLKAIGLYPGLGSFLLACFSIVTGVVFARARPRDPIVTGIAASALCIGTLFAGVLGDAPGVRAFFPWLGIAALGATGYVVRKPRRLTRVALLYIGALMLTPVGTGLLGYWQLPQGTEPELEVSQPRANALLAHLSDTHFVAEGVQTVREGKPWDETNVAKAFAAVVKNRPRYLVATGDITDVGARTQWTRATKRFRELADGKVEIILAPGNHDLHPSFAGAAELRDDFEAAELERRYFESFAALNPLVRTAEGVDLKTYVAWRPTPEDVDRARKEIARRCLELMTVPNPVDPRGRPARPSGDCAKMPSADELERRLGLARFAGACDRLFPLMREHRGNAFLILCSASASLWLADGFIGNAIGRFSSQQLDGLDRALVALKPGTRRVFVLMHHRPVRLGRFQMGAPKRFWSLIAWWDAFADSDPFHYMMLRGDHRSNARIVRTLERFKSENPERTVALLYGHSHEGYLGESGGNRASRIWLSEAPATFNDNDGSAGRFAWADEKSGLVWGRLDRLP